MAKPNMEQLVKFTIPASRLRKGSPEEANYRQVISHVFGECLGRGDWGDITFLCRLDQFALFLLRRHELGLQNMFAELNAKLVEPPKIIHMIDVSKR